MESLRERLEKPLVLGALGLFVGIILGLIWGWVIDPVEYVGAYPRDLVYEQKVEYMRMAVEAFQANGNAEKANARYQALEGDAQQALSDVLQDPQDLSPDVITSFSAVVMAQAPGEPEQPPEGEEPAEERSLFLRLLPWMYISISLSASLKSALSAPNSVSWVIRRNLPMSFSLYAISPSILRLG